MIVVYMILKIVIFHNYSRYIYLIGGLEHDFFPYIGNVIIPTDEVIIFRGIETTNQKFMGISWGYDGNIFIG